MYNEEQYGGKIMEAIKNVFKKNIRQYAMLIALVVIMVFFQIATDGILLVPMNVTNLILQNGYVFISSELPEILGMCDRVYVMNEGKIVGEVTRKDASQESIMKCIMQRTERNWR